MLLFQAAAVQDSCRQHQRLRPADLSGPAYARQHTPWLSAPQQLISAACKRQACFPPPPPAQLQRLPAQLVLPAALCQLLPVSPRAPRRLSGPQPISSQFLWLASSAPLSSTRTGRVLRETGPLHQHTHPAGQSRRQVLK